MRRQRTASEEGYERRKSAMRPPTSASAARATPTPKPGELDDVVADDELGDVPVVGEVDPCEEAVDVDVFVGLR